MNSKYSKKPLISRETKSRSRKAQEQVRSTIGGFLNNKEKNTVIVLDESYELFDRLFKSFANKGVIVEWVRDGKEAIELLSALVDRKIIGMCINLKMPNTDNGFLDHLASIPFTKVIYEDCCPENLKDKLTTMDVSYIAKNEDSVKDIVDLIIPEDLH